jgi:hypothetical protein
MKRRVIGSLLIAAAVGYSAPLLAGYTLVLKNGGRITVESYREQGSTVYFRGLGGETGIPKDQIQAIVESREGDGTELTIPELNRDIQRPQGTPLSQTTPRPSPPTGTAAPGDVHEPAGPDEAAEDQKKLTEINKKLDAAQTRYLAATQGGGPGSSATKEGYRAWTADLMSRLKARRGAPDSAYEPQEKELRDLRLEIDQLQKERDELLLEIERKKR